MKTGDVVEGRYRVVQTLGEGGLGTVFLAEHMTLGRRVALKVLRAEIAHDASVIERFMTETRKAGTLGNANIVESLDIGLTSGLAPYVVFEYLEGALLTDEIYRVGGLPVRRAVRIAQQIASALSAAHAAGIVHGALESDSVFLVDKDDVIDHVKVIDFGVARLASSVGTPEFRAPERITTPGFADKRADIYALGVMMYEMLTARRPFSNDDDTRALMHRIVTAAPPPMQRPDVPKPLEELIVRLLSKDPAARPELDEIETALATLAIATPRTRSSQDIARNSDLIPRPATLVDTAVSIAQLPPVAPTPKKAWMMYGIAAAGLLVGGAGFAMAMRSGKIAESSTVQPAPAPAVATQAPAAREVAPQKKVEVHIEANVPNARVTFRRRVSAAPATMQIGSSDIVELVEVSAPGYKTTRYWLTFDRPTRLTAKLAKGTGLEEASEEATLIALGEVAPAAEVAAPAAAPAVVSAPVVAPSPSPSPVAATVAPVAKTVERPAPATAVEPRKIGRALAEPSWEEPTAAEPTAKAEEPTPAETQKTEGTEPPKAEAPAVEPPKVEAPKVVEAPKLEAPTAEVAVAKPAIDRATISSVVGQHRPEILKCIAEGKKKTAEMKGTLTLQLQVDAAGRVRAQVQSTLGSPLVAACVIKAANAWRFPARADGDFANVAYPFTIN